MLKYITSGESHGKCLQGILEGMPAEIVIDEKRINQELARRQGGYGRGARQKIETDKVDVTGGVLRGESTGAPLGLIVWNKDFKIAKMKELTKPRPGHADFPGALKYNQGIRAVLERASARETAIRVAVGTIPRLMLESLGIEIVSHVIRVGSVVNEKASSLSFAQIKKNVKGSEVGCADKKTDARMVAEIDKATAEKDTVGGIIELRAKGLPIGIGSHVHYDRKLDSRIAKGMLSLQAVKGVGVGMGFEVGELFGSQVHDEIFYDKKKKSYYRGSNNAGGIEGGMTNGSEVVVRIAMKPISTLRKPLQSVDMKTKEATAAAFERSDICAITACGVIAESILAYELGDAFLEKFGGDSMTEIKRNLKGYLAQIK